ncbi:formiminotransferase N-terminal subdomain-containing protein isoform X3 [Girardinichthys multiradiatus]|uniref:formiminotransferase N-terminal subdomain-containing protein isoform X3 n=1 Tax=Girardinichthys multiradiatus TaxID=208333 RepID=UPI001FAE030A|nr:formiminotransferase N-terminal subdomain-containing protein isoform X3 [Girardinichthys multiradiatus]
MMKLHQTVNLSMASRSPRRRLVACLLNVSEARRKDVVENVAKAALCNAEGIQREETTVLNIFNDPDYNRSVITIVASIDSIRDAALSACQKACALIDMRTHAGVHPCMGAVDLVPFYPLGEEVGVKECVQQALAVAHGLTETVYGSSAFLFGWADTPLQRGLAQRRKEMGWFRKTPDLQALRPDVGPQPQKRYGLTAAEFVLSVCWVSVSAGCRDEVQLCEDIYRCRRQHIRHELQRHHRHPGHHHWPKHRRRHQGVHTWGTSRTSGVGSATRGSC